MSELISLSVQEQQPSKARLRKTGAYVLTAVTAMGLGIAIGRQLGGGQRVVGEYALLPPATTVLDPPVATENVSPGDYYDSLDCLDGTSYDAKTGLVALSSNEEFDLIVFPRDSSLPELHFIDPDNDGVLGFEPAGRQTIDQLKQLDCPIPETVNTPTTY